MKRLVLAILRPLFKRYSHETAWKRGWGAAYFSYFLWHLIEKKEICGTFSEYMEACAYEAYLDAISDLI